MTPEAEKNLIFVKDSSTYAGFGSNYHEAIEKGIKAGLREIALEPGYKQFNEGTYMQYQPKVIEAEGMPGYYNFKGFQATLAQEGKEAVSQFFSTYRMSGVTAEQSYALLTGGTVLQKDWDNANNEKKYAYVRLDMSKAVAEGVNYPVIRVNEKEVDIARLYSRADIVASQDEKERHLQILQSGGSVTARMREESDAASTRTTSVSIQLNLQDPTKMELKITDSSGKVLPPVSIDVKKSTRELVGLKMGNNSENKLPDNIVAMFQKKGQPSGLTVAGGPEGPKTPKTPKQRA